MSWNISSNIVAFVPLVFGKSIVSGSLTAKLIVGKSIKLFATIDLLLILAKATDDEGSVLSL